MNTLRNSSVKLVSRFIPLTLAAAGMAIAPGAFAQPQPAKPIQQIDIVRLDPGFDKLVPLNVDVERIVSGRAWVEGPVWNRREKYLLFSDIPTNSIIKWQEGKGTSVFFSPSGYTGTLPFEGPEPGSNGLASILKGAWCPRNMAIDASAAWKNMAKKPRWSTASKANA